MKKQLARFGFGLMASALFMGTALAEMPKTVNLQSVVYDPDGNVTTASSVSVSVRIVDELGNIFFQEDHNDVPVVKGAMNLVIGESSGGIPADALDPTSGRRFMDVLVDGSNPFDILPLSAVPYALWADKAVSVAKDGVTAESIKDGAIEPRHLAKDFDISKVSGVMTDAQVPANIVRQETFNLHTGSATAHEALAITNTAFPGQLGGTVQVALETLYNNYAQEVANRQTSVNSLTTTVNGISTQVTTNKNNIANHEGRITTLEGNVASLSTKVNVNHETRIAALEGAPYDPNEHAFGWGVVNIDGSAAPGGHNFGNSSKGAGLLPYHVSFAGSAADNNVIVLLTIVDAALGSATSIHVSNANASGFDVTCSYPNGGTPPSLLPTGCSFHWLAFANH